ncbi:hypothetical protein AXW67_03930 [Bradyrhizobium neotropicale]|uniref:Uncharacterized protein n=1 Tax=Bradyrhizobium neotropicale TaxID=1497615 RepID=A0A176ZDL3_9BRAD|nr:hypothetical protein AXW67_03930 [Bradyrhizobium neotropicale]
MSELAERHSLSPKMRRAASAKATPIRKSNIKSTSKNSNGSDREQGETALAAAFARALERKAVR